MEQIINYISNMNLIDKPLIIIGSSGSGKTYTINNIIEQYGKNNCVKINLENFLKNKLNITINEKKIVIIQTDNYDCIELNLLYDLINKIKNKDLGEYRKLMTSNYTQIKCGNFVIELSTDKLTNQTLDFLKNYEYFIDLD